MTEAAFRETKLDERTGALIPMCVIRLLDSFFSSIDAVGGRFTRAINRFARIDYYEVEGEFIVKRKGWFRKEFVDARVIQCWWYLSWPIIFDIVYIRLNDGTLLKWLDRDNDLLGALRRLAGPKWCESPPSLP